MKLEYLGAIIFAMAVIYFLGYFLGAVNHERDLARNFKEYGDAKAWFNEIKID